MTAASLQTDLFETIPDLPDSMRYVTDIISRGEERAAREGAGLAV